MAASLNLLIDADDTLWVNASLFEKALGDWSNLLREYDVEADRSMAIFHEIEERGFRRGWFGCRRLEINMNAATRFLLSREISMTLAEPIRELVQRVRGPEVLLFDGVQETLHSLGRHHRLFLVTMGERDEQQVKVDTSGLGHYFSAVHILPDKTRRQYADLIRKHRLERRDSWMIGNSLTKDIQPARAAGLKTCHLANGHEFEFGAMTRPIAPDLQVSDFHRLKELFDPAHESYPGRQV